LFSGNEDNGLKWLSGTGSKKASLRLNGIIVERSGLIIPKHRKNDKITFGFGRLTSVVNKKSVSLRKSFGKTFHTVPPT
jgi:hypothetical protein